MSASAKGVWENIASDYASRGLVLVLGAGISVASGFPNWGELLRRLGERCMGPAGSDLVLHLHEAGYSYGMIAGVLKSSNRAGTSFVELVRDELYRDFPFYKRLRVSKDKLVSSVKKANPTLRAVGALCAVRNVSGEFEPNPQIHAIVNFNLDAVLRRYTEYRYDRIILRTVERASADASSTKINTYHIHGFLQFELSKIGDRELEADTIVLAEDEYFDFFGKPFGMFSYTMLHMLREHPCLFVGLSMVDENLRRLLHYSRSERVRSYEAEGVSPKRAVHKCDRHYAILRRTTNRAVDSAVEKSLANLGVAVAWLDDYAELPDRLRDVYTAAGRVWDDVY